MSINRNQSRDLKQPFLHIPVPWVFVFAYLIGAGLEVLFPFGIRSSEVSLVSQIGGAVFFLIGAIIAGWGLFIFHNARTTTVPGETSAKLVRSGPYQFSRNPMYVGLVVAYLEETGLLVQVWPLLTSLFAVVYVNWFVIPVEEARLKEDFGNEYEQYCAKVRRWI
ncbi:MAG: isoprenylcysteine carboxylmethyltransferase family protein [Anaerolineales bacterium]